MHLKLDELNEMEKLSKSSDHLYRPSLENMISLLQRHSSMGSSWLRKFEYVLAELTDKCFEIKDHKNEMVLSKKPDFEDEIEDLLLELETTEEAGKLRWALIKDCQSLWNY